MIYHHPIQKDTYITDKIIMNAKRSTTSNVGQASTLDLFKLWNENLMRGETGDILEYSHLLVQADLEDLRTNLAPIVDITNTSLKVKLILKDVQGTQIAPRNFTIDVIQQTQDWNEGNGADVASFNDLDASNWTNATTDTAWTNPGGIPNAPTIIASQTFEAGNEDLEVDITSWVKEVWNGNITNYGWVFKFSDANVNNEYSYFVKRFSSRHTRNPYQRPLLVVTWDDHHQDDRLQFEVGSENTIAIQNYVKGVMQNLGVVTCELSYGTWTLSASSIGNVTIGGISHDGWYEATFRAIDPVNVDTDLQAALAASDEIVLTETWYNDGTAFSTGELTLKNNLVLKSSRARDYRISLMEMKEKYTHDETPIIRLYVRDKRLDNEPVRIPIELPSQRLDSAWYRIKDYGNRTEPVVDFSYPENWTRVSTDGTGMYFTLPTQILPSGRTFSIDIMYLDRGKTYVWESKTSFRVEGE